jgi:hypothetical protein
MQLERSPFHRYGEIGEVARSKELPRHGDGGFGIRGAHGGGVALKSFTERVACIN